MPSPRDVIGRPPLAIRVWLGLSRWLPFVLTGVARVFHRRQGAAPDRLAERFGIASQARPSGRMIWIHAASVGELASVARLGRQLIDHGDVALLVTTTTATGAATAARVLPGAVHQFLPVDTPGAVRRFLDHWHPDAAIFVESDLWPRMVLTLAARACPMVLLNVRPSRTRHRFPAASAALLARFQMVTVQEPDVRDDLLALGLDPARILAPGNLKADIDLPWVDESLRDQWERAAQGRGIWAAVSTHAGEEAQILEVHAALSGRPLLLLVPRHPERGDEVASALAGRGIVFTRHSLGAQPDSRTQVHLVDALGVTGTVYAAAGLAFVGGSLDVGRGGHTPFEPVALGCAVLSGPDVHNFASAYKVLQAEGAAILVPDHHALGRCVANLLRDAEAVRSLQSAARKAYAAQGGATERTLGALAKALPGVLTPLRPAVPRND